ncbi:MAG: hypothetical protein K9N09_02470 [Candidatus Cloacimonetes bacterium]|nr:hypothetical protein [Candidatus Cloacimonadota bacterium]MCF7813090.1 hypothetical protein [Candidatus Cloacimonadota bacterium]MCF7867539.1 hypothetical protein [Candidatus Cloacimonadota bacterium]MCF7883067.1 hypothetical protein [Candidatus Cloacimonadota bacterium]
MFYADLLDRLIPEEENPVNKMYLTELKLKWKGFEKILDEKKLTNELIVQEFNKFLKNLNSRKFKYLEGTKKGFKPDSEIFSSLYLDDFISIFLSKKSILKNLGIEWGRQSFTTGMNFNPLSFGEMEKNPNFEIDDSPMFLSLIQNIDFQFRITGKRRFNKYQLKFPLLVFHTFTNLDLNDLIRSEYYANMAKATFRKVKTIIVTETLDKELTPDVRSLPIEAVFVLRKQYSNENLMPISFDVVERLSEMIDSLLAGHDDVPGNFVETGIIR